jgi:hypothetical protein
LYQACSPPNDVIPDLQASVNGVPSAPLAYLGNGDGTFTQKGGKLRQLAIGNG